MSRVRKSVFIVLFFLGLSLQGVAQQVLATVQVGTSPGVVAANPVTNKTYVSGTPLAAIDGATDTVTRIGSGTAIQIAVNSATNKIYLLYSGLDFLFVLDGVTQTTTAVPILHNPVALALNSVTNLIYVASSCGTTCVAGGVTVVDGATNAVKSVLAVGADPFAVAVNSVSNTIYVANLCAQLVNSSCNGARGTVSVVNGANDNTVSVNVGVGPTNIALDSTTNKIYVPSGDSELTVINGANLTASVVPVGSGPVALAVNSVTNMIYLGDSGDSNLWIIDGASQTANSVNLGAPVIDAHDIAVNEVTNTIYVGGADNKLRAVDGANLTWITLVVGNGPAGVAVNASTNRIYVTNAGDNTVSVIGGASAPPLRFIPITPCRVVDTRNANGPFGGPAIQGQTSRDFPLPQGACGIPSTAAAYSLNVAVVPRGTLSYLTVWPTGEERPLVATLNSIDGRTKSNAAIVPAGANQAISVFATQTTDVILDVNGYFVPASQSDALAFYPLTPCRVVDTRGATGPLGGPNLVGGKIRDFPIRTDNTCNIPPTAVAYSLNFAVVPQGPLSYLTAWPSDQQQPVVATLNDPKGVTTANAAIVPGAASNGDINVYATANAALIIDVNGYFAPASSGGLSLYAVAPCRVLDTRQTSGAFNGTLAPIQVENSACEVNPLAQAYVFNATAVPQGPVGYLTLWPDTETRPVVATLNAPDGAITNNMAIVPTLNGAIDAYAAGTTNLILDIFGFFAP